jgi:hypothetical protein
MRSRERGRERRKLGDLAVSQVVASCRKPWDGFGEPPHVDAQSPSMASCGEPQTGSRISSMKWIRRGNYLIAPDACLKAYTHSNKSEMPLTLRHPPSEPSFHGTIIFYSFKFNYCSYSSFYTFQGPYPSDGCFQFNRH